MMRSRRIALRGSVPGARLLGIIAVIGACHSSPLAAQQQSAPKPKGLPATTATGRLPAQSKPPVPLPTKTPAVVPPAVITTAPLILNAVDPAAPVMLVTPPLLLFAVNLDAPLVIRTDPLILNAVPIRSKP
ncbi:MAG: hypothetical protein K8S21_12275 [Gemmatimonadetes bacterium]|nr:hypothetical protein [Gemmatimonadota bacterium]